MMLFPPTGFPSPPRTPSYSILQYAHDNVTLEVHWNPPQYDGGAPINYNITVSPGFDPSTTSSISHDYNLTYNIAHTVTVLANNCIGSSSVAMTIIKIGIYLSYLASMHRDNVMDPNGFSTFM